MFFQLLQVKSLLDAAMLLLCYIGTIVNSIMWCLVPDSTLRPATRLEMGGPVGMQVYCS